MDIQTLLKSFTVLLDKTIFPFLLALGGFVFLWNVTRYFIIGGSNSEDQEKARSLAMWGILAFVFILSLWGIVNLFVNGFAFGPKEPITPDYIQSRP